MNDKKIITQKEKNYIETLYLNFNLENVSDNDIDHPTLKYYNILSYMADTMFPNAVFLGISKGRNWYQFPNYKLGIMDYDTAKNAKQFNCVIQYFQHHLFTLDKNLNGLDLPFDVPLKHYHIKRIDITKIAKHDEDYLTNYGFISPYRREDRVNGTVYLGHRDNGNVFRMYNKTIELRSDTKKHPINYKKIDLLSAYFGDIENLWTYELELSRSFLKSSLGIETLAQLPLIYEANQNIVSKIRFYKNSDRNKKLIRDSHRHRIPCRVLTDFVEFERIQKKKYVTSEEYAIDRSIKVFDTYLDSMGLDRTNDAYMKLFNRAIAKRVDYNNKNIAITFEDTHLSNEIDQMTAKYNLLRENQTNELELEARRHFGEFVSDKNAVAEIKV